MPTLAQVAQKAGVSIATVSKVLSNTPYFTDETRDKVMVAVEELGYVPNLAARALSTGKTHIIAVVFPYVYDTVFTDPLVQQILQGVESETSEKGYNLLLSSPRLTESAPDPNFVSMLQSGYLDGMVALDNVPLMSVINIMREHGKREVPTVVIGYGEHDYTVRSDDMNGGRAVIQHLLELGHRDIGFIAVPEDSLYSVTYRLQGYAEALAHAGLDIKTMPRADANFSITGGAEAAAQLLTDFPQLTALVCVNDRMAFGAIQQAQAMGRRVPQDLTVIGYDDIAMAELFAPSLTTIDQHSRELGQVATRMLFDVIRDLKPESVVVPTNLHVRESSAPPK